MRRTSIAALASAALLAGGVAWMLRASSAPSVPTSIEVDAVPPSAPLPEARPSDPGAVAAAPVSPDRGETVAVESVFDPNERLPEIRVGDRGRVARFRPQVFKDGMQLVGDVLLAGLVEGRDVWVRWDAEATRTRFLRERFPMPAVNVLPNGDAIVFVEPMPPLFRYMGFSCRLDGSVLRIGAEGVYPPAEAPVPERPPDVPPPDPSPR